MSEYPNLHLYCSHEIPSDQKDCSDYCIKETHNWLDGKTIGVWDHKIFTYLQDIVSSKFPEHLFVGYSLDIGWVGCRLDRYMIKNGKQISHNMLYLDKIDWSRNYDPEFENNS